MTRITVTMTLPDDAVTNGWSDDTSELEASVRATLHELNGDDGDVYQPDVLSVAVERG